MSERQGTSLIQILGLLIAVSIVRGAMSIVRANFPFIRAHLGLIIGLSLTGLMATVIVMRLRRPRLYPLGHCQKCGYDLMLNVSGACPECGTAIQSIGHPRRRRQHL